MSKIQAKPVGNSSAPKAKKAEPENLAVRPDLPPTPSHLKSLGTDVWFATWAAGGDSYSPVTDAHVIERYAALHDRRQELMDMLKDEGMVTVGSTGQQVLHPAARFIAETEKMMSGLEDKLGMNPESRLRLGISAIEKESKLDQFLNK